MNFPLWNLPETTCAVIDICATSIIFITPLQISTGRGGGDVLLSVSPVPFCGEIGSGK